MTLYHLLQKYPWNEISEFLSEIEVYSEEGKNTYKKVYGELHNMEPADSRLSLLITKSEDSCNEEQYIDVSGLHKDPQTYEEKFPQGIEFIAWQQWLGMEILPEVLQQFSEQQIIVYSLAEMTVVAFSNAEIQQKMREIKARHKLRFGS